MQAFDLAQSPFHILRVSPRASIAELNEAKADRLFDGDVSEAELENALSELMVDSKRLLHEIAWLTDVAPNRARQLVEQAISCDAAAASALVREGGELTQLNLAAHLCARFPHQAQLSEYLIERYARIDWTAVRQVIDEARLLSRFGATRDASWKAARAELIARHSSAIASAVTGLADGPAVLTRIVTNYANKEHDQAHDLVGRLVAQYDRWSTPKLEPISERISILLTELDGVSEADHPLQELDDALEAWDSLNQPVQLWEQSRGLDEPRSLNLSRKVRNTAISLANDAGRHEVALHMTRSLLRTFAELPSVVAETTKDLETLENLVEEQRSVRLLEPLQRATESVEANFPRSAGQILRGSFTSQNQDEVGRLRAAFETAKQSRTQLPNPDLPWLIVRSVALDLHNNFAESEAARIIVEVLLTDAPAFPRQRLEEDLKTLKSIAAQNRFAAALEAKDLSLASAILSEMIAHGYGNRNELNRIRDNLDSAISRRRNSRIGWGVAAAVVLLLIIAGQGNPPRTTYAPPPAPYLPPVDTSPVMTSPEDSVPLPSLPASTESDLTEEAPAPYAATPLTRTQLRYCRFENARMERLQEVATDNAMIDRFNARVQDYNGRCGSYQYSYSDMDIVNGQLADQRTRLRAEADEIAAGWRRPAVTRPPEPRAQDPLVPDSKPPTDDENFPEANNYVD